MLLQGNQGQSGKQLGQNITAGLGEYSDITITELMPRYYEWAYRGAIFTAANTAAQALSVGSATFTGLAVANPAGSGKNLVMVDCTLGLAAALSAVATPVLGYAATVALTVGNSGGPFCSLVGSGTASVAKVGASATLGAAPTVIRPLHGFQWVTANVTTAACYTKDEIAGAIIVPPGQLICVEALVAAVTVVAGFTWIEVLI